jgi:two-component system nitrogen regulation sensor histidine kinase NtrY
LTPIQLAAERIKRKYKNHITLEPDVFLSCISIIIRQVNGMRNIVDEFSAFSRMPLPVYKKANLTNLVRELGSISLVSNKIINVDIIIPKKNIFAIIDENQIRQALQNIISNAINAMSERKIKNNIKNKLIIELKDISNNSYIILVKDTGMGLPSNILGDLTDPYVTTRKNGTGLGLAIVKKIMEDHDGELILENLKNNSGVCASLVFSDKV